MTEDELDLLASAYLDGEATSEEVDMVERDPELLARVETLRSISEQVAVPVNGPSAEVKERHLAAALSAFSAQADSGAESSADAETDTNAGAATAPVIDLTERARRPRSASSSASSSARSSSGRSMPRWLPAAAALLLFGGAGALIASQGLGGSDDAMESADAGSDTATEAGESESEESAEAAVAAADSDAAGNRSTDDAVEEEAMELVEDDAMDEEAMEDDEAMEEESDGEAADSQATGPAPEEPEGGFFPEDPVLFFDTPPDADQVLRDRAPNFRADVAQSQCGDFAAPLTDGSVLGYLPIEIAGEPAELFVLVRENGTESALILMVDSCQLLNQ